MTRRLLLAASAATAFAQPRRRRILLRTAWQTRNIGDVCFTPAMLGALARYVPEADVTCWMKQSNAAADAMIRAAFPTFTPVTGTIGDPEAVDLSRAFDAMDLFLYNSGMVINYGLHGNMAWEGPIAATLPLFASRERGKPYGVYAQTFDIFADPSPLVFRAILSGAAFLYTRDTISLGVLKKAGIAPPVADYAPDIAFQFRLRAEDRARAYLASAGLEPGRFLMAIVHYAVLSRPGVRERGAAHLEKMRQVLIRWVRETGLPILVAPEDEREIALGKELLIDPMPADVRSRMVLRDTFWLPDEALSVALHSRTMFNMEPHLNIMALANGLPCLHCFDYAFGRKAEMFRHIGLGDWLFELGPADPTAMGDALLAVHRDYDAAQRRREKAMAFVEERTAAAFGQIRQTLGLKPL